MNIIKIKSKMIFKINYFYGCTTIILLIKINFLYYPLNTERMLKKQ